MTLAQYIDSINNHYRLGNSTEHTSSWLQSRMIEVAKSGKSQTFPKELVLKGLKT